MRLPPRVTLQTVVDPRRRMAARALTRSRARCQAAAAPVLSGRATLARAQVVTRAMTEAGDDEYNDLDELVARYAEPYMRNVEAVTKHRRAPRKPPLRWGCRMCHARTATRRPGA